uniref:protein O-GlcNAcase n=1 Tax=Romanomermis culicivorax TaxID=13658 RepID=A0A915K7W7_ROMCU
MPRHYICGVVEGFYGRPWSLEQRRDLFRRLDKFGLNSYVYAPKDDIKHRALWRQLYVDEEIMNLRLLITSAKESNIKFYYAISPGLDIDYSSEEEIDRLKMKLDQVKSLGCDCFAVLFDDIEMTMSSTNKGQFRTYAEAQAFVTNKLFEYLKEPDFLFCPTEYCESRCEPDLMNSEYLLALGKYLNTNIEVLWTGPKVISRLITVDHLDQVCKIVGRRPVIWDNLFANDYDIMRRLFLGPFTGRPVAVKSRTNGFLLNPNCQYEANFTPLFTLAAWNVALNDLPTSAATSAQNSSHKTSDDDFLEPGGEMKCGLDEIELPLSSMYNPESIFNRALEHWVTIAGVNRPAIFYKATPAATLPEEKMDAAPPGDIDGVSRAAFLSVAEKE